MCSNEINVMITIKKIPGTALESETIQGSFYVGTVEQPNPGFNNMEIWKDITDYEGYYQISNFGRVKSLNRIALRKRNGIYHNYHVKGKILSNCVGIYGYYNVKLRKNRILKTHEIHRLVWDAFGNRNRNGHKLEIDHIDNNPKNSNINNLQLLTHRENLIKGIDKTKTSSKYIGVTWRKRQKSWEANIYINGESKYLGLYKNEIEASDAYKNELKNQK